MKAKRVLAGLEATSIGNAAPNDAKPVLRRGSNGQAVAELQAGLRATGYPLAIDSDFGPATELAVMQFQAANELEMDGIVGPATWSELA